MLRVKGHSNFSMVVCNGRLLYQSVLAKVTFSISNYSVGVCNKVPVYLSSESAPFIVLLVLNQELAVFLVCLDRCNIREDHNS